MKPDTVPPVDVFHPQMKLKEPPPFCVAKAEVNPAYAGAEAGATGLVVGVFSESRAWVPVHMTGDEPNASLKPKAVVWAADMTTMTQDEVDPAGAVVIMAKPASGTARFEFVVPSKDICPGEVEAPADPLVIVDSTTFWLPAPGFT